MACIISEVYYNWLVSCAYSCFTSDSNFKERHTRYQSTIRIIMLIRLIPIWLVIYAVDMHIESGDSELFRRVLTDQYEGCKLALQNYKENASKDILNYDSQELRDHCEYTPKDAQIGSRYIWLVMVYVALFSYLNFKFSKILAVRILDIDCLMVIILLQYGTIAHVDYSLAKSMAIYSYFGGTKEYEFVLPSVIITFLNAFDIAFRCNHRLFGAQNSISKRIIRVSFHSRIERLSVG
ncbi:MAG: hypothetical protein MHMPM18_001476 [Marteilia pararefringens]